MRQALIMVGTPGSGKSTFVEKVLRDNPDLTRSVHSTDNFFQTPLGYMFDLTRLAEAHAWCFRNFIESCKRKIDLVVCDNTNTSLPEIAPYIQAARAYGYKPRVLVVDAPVEVCAVRNVHGVPFEAIDRMHDKMFHMLEQWPHFWPQPEYTVDLTSWGSSDNSHLEHRSRL